MQEECEKVDEIVTSKSSIIDKHTKAQTIFNDSDFVVADEDTQNFRNITIYETNNNCQKNKPYNTVSAEFMMKVWELSEMPHSRTMNEVIKLSPQPIFNKRSDK